MKDLLGSICTLQLCGVRDQIYEILQLAKHILKEAQALYVQFQRSFYSAMATSHLPQHSVLECFSSH